MVGGDVYYDIELLRPMSCHGAFVQNDDSSFFWIFPTLDDEFLAELWKTLWEVCKTLRLSLNFLPDYVARLWKSACQEFF